MKFLGFNRLSKFALKTSFPRPIVVCSSVPVRFGLSPLQRQSACLQQRLQFLQVRCFSKDIWPQSEDESPIDPDDPTGEKEIYRGILTTQIKLVKSFSLMTSAIGLSMQPILYIKAQSAQNAGIFLATGAFFSFFTFVTPLLIHWVSKKYVTELYYNKLTDTYTAVTYSLLLQKKKLEFRVQDVKVPDIPGAFTTFRARNVPLFVEGELFADPKHYGKIMGYDKPIDLRWSKHERKS